MEHYDSALSQLRKMIAAPEAVLNNRLPPERALAAELGVGRRTLRRALGTLESEGRILRHRGRGTFIRNDELFEAADIAKMFEHTNPMEVMEVRLAVEPMMARLASFRASRRDIEKLQHLAEETRTAERAADYVTADTAFHRRIAKASRNALNIALHEALSAVSRDTSGKMPGENGRCYKSKARYAQHHQEITAAIAARDGDRAYQAMYEHLLDVQRVILDSAFPETALRTG
jgi:DNA-binding FadR family transcriptional regulator